MDAIERLEAIDEIGRLKARYFRCMDGKDWEGFAEVWCDDAQLDISEEMGDNQAPVVGRQAIVDLVSRAIGPATTVHHGHMPEITIESDREASGVWAMEDHLLWPEGGPVRSMHGYGHYHERYRRTDAGWRIARLKLTRLRLDLDPAPPG